MVIKIIAFIIYFLFLVFWAIFSGMIFYHLNRFGYEESPCKKMLLIYVFVAIFIIILTLFFSLIGNWQFDNLEQILD